MPSYLPSVLVLCGALIAAFGAFLADRSRSKKNEDMQKLVAENRSLAERAAENDVKKTELLQDLAARTGNSKQLEELIRLRSRVLNAEGEKADKLADEIIAVLPTRRADYVELEKTKQAAYEAKAADFRLKWQPFIQTTLDSFDGLVAECQKRGLPLETWSSTEFPYAKDDLGPPQRHQIRQVKWNKAQISVHFRPVSIGEHGHSLAGIEIDIAPKEGLIMSIGLGLDEGVANRHSPPATNGIKILAPKNGIPSTEFVSYVQHAVRSAIERFLLVAGLEDKQ